MLAVGGAVVAFFVLPMLGMHGKSSFWLFVMVAGLVGYLTPSLWLDKRVKAKKAEHQAGFPDFMDLLVVCADAGLAMEASLDRVGRELGEAYPSLAANIHMATLEIRAGRTLSEALDHLGDRLGLDEARSFATLIQQSDELGSSISDALRVYSEDMRHKRMSRAEEKAYAPARQALGADDGVHLPDAVRRDPAAGHRAHVHRQLAVTTGEFPFRRTLLSDQIDSVR